MIGESSIARIDENNFIAPLPFEFHFPSKRGGQAASDCAPPTLSLEGRLDGLPLRVSNEDLRSPIIP